MNCDRCGASIQVNAKFCEECGSAVGTINSAVPVDVEQVLNRIKNQEIRSRIHACIQNGMGVFKPDNCRLVLKGAGIGWNLNGKGYGIYLWQVKRFYTDIALYQKCGLEDVKEAYNGTCVSAKIRDGESFDKFMGLVEKIIESGVYDA